MLEIINPSGDEIDGETSPRIIVGPAGTFTESSEDESILVDGGLGSIHKSTFVDVDACSINKPTPVDVDAYIGAEDIPSERKQADERSNVYSKWKSSYDLINTMTKRSSGIIKTKFADALSKSSSNIRRLIFSAKSGIKAFKEAYLANLEADTSSTHLDSPIVPQLSHLILHHEE